MKFVYTLLCSVVLVSSCSTNPSLPRFDTMMQEATGQNGRACVRKGDIDGYGVLKHDIVSIDGGRKYYLATLMPGCMDIQMSMAALFSGRFIEVCGGSNDKIVTREESCQIRQMFEFESREAAFEVYDSLVEKRQQMQDAQKQAKTAN